MCLGKGEKKRWRKGCRLRSGFFQYSESQKAFHCLLVTFFFDTRHLLDHPKRRPVTIMEGEETKYFKILELFSQIKRHLCFSCFRANKFLFAWQIQTFCRIEHRHHVPAGLNVNPFTVDSCLFHFLFPVDSVPISPRHAAYTLCVCSAMCCFVSGCRKWEKILYTILCFQSKLFFRGSDQNISKCEKISSQNIHPHTLFAEKFSAITQKLQTSI